MTQEVRDPPTSKQRRSSKSEVRFASKDTENDGQTSKKSRHGSSHKSKDSGSLSLSQGLRVSSRLGHRSQSRTFRLGRFLSLPDEEDDIGEFLQPESQGMGRHGSTSTVVDMVSKRKTHPPASYQLSIQKDELRYSAFGERHSLDVVSLPHNAVRSELRDLNVLSRALTQLQTSVTTEDLSLFMAWWQGFAAFTTEYFDFEEKVLFPYVITSIEEREWARISSVLYRMKRTALQELQALDVAADNMRRKDSEALRLLEAGINYKLQHQLCCYFEEEEKILPDLLERNVDPRMCDLLQTKLLEHLSSSSNSKDNVIILTYWLRNRPVVFQSWCSAHMTLTTRVSYPRWKRRFEVRHKGSVSRLEHRLCEANASPVGKLPPNHTQ